MQFSYEGRTIRINLPDMPALMTEIARRLHKGEGFALATLNLDHLVKLRSDPQFRQAYAEQDLVCADGNPVVWLSRCAGRPVTLVPGSDIVIPLARLAAAEDAPIALVGSTMAALDAAAESLSRAAPGITIAARIAPPMGFDPASPSAGRLLEEVQASGARLCFLALGAPKQELLAARGRRETPEVGFASIGAGLDFLAGNQRRAPLWVRRLAMEWAWRMATAPRRLMPRYARCAAILPAELAAALKLRR
ncbi:MAG: WecB/TagA/CpsF family glycosyltransferase [Paracoccus sp. (in: a-proteobacteria)]|nr:MULTISPECIES: WecB/TagA/CpsF family glycosyltransferase [unclassified Paracoccus (in: a-proteobacteria)]MAN56430.1 glycosyltransferase [Paracoccus sp. (in: a-proteobacteria)]MAN57257.1 glycosyltransferase [Paracoccus sp. (in: a-proteobacteria)]MBA48895.1 glycosyltransferase [Paracoccus sp. (in: a-proteobacteria)]MCS5601450.1 WecB/TagA/CpsF family glycosyltransferase [Paracoccus sp. (in: a-proteobacteria)]